jgi:hypothetical protein
MAVEEGVEEGSIEFRRRNVWRAVAPPIRRRCSVLEPDATEEPGVAKYESSLRLPEHEVIVVFGAEIRWLGAQLPGHAEVDADPIAAGELEQHLFSPRERADETPPRHLTSERSRIGAAEDAFPGMELDGQDLLPEAWVPLSAIIFDFGEFRHWTQYSAIVTGIAPAGWFGLRTGLNDPGYNGERPRARFLRWKK